MRRQWERVGESVKAWISHASHGDTKELRERMLARYSFRATEGRAAEGVGPNRAGAGFNNEAPRLRAAYRNRNQPDNRNDNIGFRLVRDVGRSVPKKYFSAAGGPNLRGKALSV